MLYTETLYPVSHDRCSNEQHKRISRSLEKNRELFEVRFRPTSMQHSHSTHSTQPIIKCRELQSQLVVRPQCRTRDLYRVRQRSQSCGGSRAAEELVSKHVKGAQRALIARTTEAISGQSCALE